MKTIITLCILFIALPVSAGTWRDDFEDGNLDGWKQEFPLAQDPDPSIWKIVDSELECERRDFNSALLITGKPEWKDYTIEYDVKLLENLGLGDVDFIARYKSPSWTHLILICFGDSLGFPSIATLRYPDNVTTSKPFDPLDLKKWYHLKLEVKGRKFILWLDGKVVLEHEDGVVNEGAVGIGLANYIARFDNVQISGPDVPDFKPPTWKEQSVQSHDKLIATWGAIKSNY